MPSLKQIKPKKKLNLTKQIIIMKTSMRLFTIAITVYVLLALTSCTTYTCPTYSKVDQQSDVTPQEVKL
ncbi:unnamed protein product [marine sediment metagenome]|uniref:Uncharacterized protein n=1 Tax=marine sediment metagenome TaxID=412755 RepID=X0Z4K5_9ZZZZ